MRVPRARKEGTKRKSVMQEDTNADARRSPESSRWHVRSGQAGIMIGWWGFCGFGFLELRNFFAIAAAYRQHRKHGWPQ